MCSRRQDKECCSRIPNESSCGGRSSCRDKERSSCCGSRDNVGYVVNPVPQQPVVVVPTCDAKQPPVLIPGQQQPAVVVPPQSPVFVPPPAQPPFQSQVKQQVKQPPQWPPQLK